jgi:hypothetical protein
MEVGPDVLTLAPSLSNRPRWSVGTAFSFRTRVGRHALIVLIGWSVDVVAKPFRARWVT